MSPIPPTVKAEILADPYYKQCARASEMECDGRVTWEHAWIYAGKQIQERWAIVPLCVYHHLGAGLEKHLNQYLSLQRATPEDLAKYPKKNWAQEYSFLSSKYEI